MSRRALGAVALVALVSLLAHLRSISAGFVFDDPFAFVNSPWVNGPLDLVEILRRDFWGALPGQGVGTWRPLPVLTFWLDAHVGGGAPWVFHATNVLGHVLASLALAVAARSPLAGALFGVLAAGSEAVDAVVGRADVMAAGLSFAAWALSRRSGRTAALAYLAAMLCKESAVVLPVWLLLVEKPRRAQLWLAAALAAYVGLRWGCFGLRADDVLLTENNNILLGEPVGVRLATALSLLARAFGLILWPASLSPDYSYAQILPEHGVPVVGLAVLAALVAGAVALPRRVGRGIVIFGVGWLAVGNVVQLLPTIFAERLLYLPAAGLAVALAAGLELLRGRARVVALAAGTLLLGGNLARSVIRAGDWHDDLTLWTSAVETVPRCARAWTNLGAELRRRGAPADAVPSLERALAIAPRWALPKSLLGATFDDLGRREEAERSLREAVAMDRDLEDAAFNLGLFLARHGRAAEAAIVLGGHVRRHPDARRARELLADLDRGRPRGAR